MSSTTWQMPAGRHVLHMVSSLRPIAALTERPNLGCGSGGAVSVGDSAERVRKQAPRANRND
jgi:hypothetical protein